MKRLLLPLLSLLASASFVSAAATVARVEGGQLVITADDGKSALRCDSLTLLRANKPIATLSVAGGMVWLKDADLTIQAAELHMQDADGIVYQAVGNGKITVTKPAATTGPTH